MSKNGEGLPEKNAFCMFRGISSSKKNLDPDLRSDLWYIYLHGIFDFFGGIIVTGFQTPPENQHGTQSHRGLEHVFPFQRG